VDRLAEVLELGQLKLDAGLFEDAVDELFCIYGDELPSLFFFLVNRRSTWF
jgi:hypothetical protein